ncbi:sigma-70 family RNA polymerase sigma factor [Yinghuangia seranimata]|uniref:sigma-70 family RNA polymerase sigma factor n=1 Tax=Yinghuangia seranimata TaxID=408067 RepID=UPI00248CF049|nr:sigma-70 family RNA polymerase sigma factor [Yinghuangia seranimata]MDI2127626.1 sigma-70 family RNA polymerase sigma factor [Yinghuangia seranimata]
MGDVDGEGAHDAAPATVSGRPGAPAAGLALAVLQEFVEFVDREDAPLVLHLRMRGAQLEDAKDAAQEAFMTAWQHVQQFDGWGGVASPRAWIRTVAWRAWCRPPGRRRIQPTVIPVAELPDRPDAGAEHAEATVVKETTLAALSRCSDQVRAVMVFHLEGFPAREIAATLGLTDQQVRDALRAGRLKARAAFTDAAHFERGYWRR